jgi:1,4-dihydroxy-2-naphthoyl-CoA synthase
MKQASNIVVVSPINGISRIKLNEPSTYNALSSKTLKSLINIFKSLNNENETKVIIIEGSGKGFSGGHDLKEIRSLEKKSKYNKLFNLCSKLMLEIVEGKKPVIAKVHGAAFAAGCQLVANIASSELIAKSQLATNWQPAAKAAPCTLAITGFLPSTISNISFEHKLNNLLYFDFFLSTINYLTCVRNLC